MGRPFKKPGNSKEDWLDWLRDDPPAPSAQEELRERYKKQANSYQPLNRTQPPRPPAPPADVAAPERLAQPQAQSQVTQTLAASPTASKTPTPATVSIQIHIPSLQNERFRNFISRIKQGWRDGRSWLFAQWRLHRRRTVGISVAVVVVLSGVFLPPLFLGGKHSANGSASGSSAGGDTAKYDKPPFQVVTPSNKTKLATPDGVHAAYDGKKNVYSYSDSIGSNGFIVSEQPIPTQFNTTQEAITKIGQGVYSGSNAHTVSTFSGDAYITSKGDNAQTVVFSVHNLLLFIQSSHEFSDTAIQDYINLMQ